MPNGCVDVLNNEQRINQVKMMGSIEPQAASNKHVIYANIPGDRAKYVVKRSNKVDADDDNDVLYMRAMTIGIHVTSLAISVQQ